jgi:hypothetical protein
LVKKLFYGLKGSEFRTALVKNDPNLHLLNETTADSLDGLFITGAVLPFIKVV